MIRTALVVAGLLLLVGAPAAAATIRHDRADALYTGAAAAFPEVGRLSGSGRVCSGTLVASRWVLTAAHCLDGASALDFTVAGTSHAADTWVQHPGWTGNFAEGSDLGLVHLAGAVSGVTPATIDQTVGSVVLQVGTSVGFGHSGTGLTGASPPAGTKRAGDNVIDATGAASGPADLGSFGSETIVVPFFDAARFATEILFADFDEPGAPLSSTLGSPVPLDLEALIAPGDSGGPVVSGGRVVAVHSFALATDGAADSSYGDLMGSVAVAPHAPWILSVVPEPPLPALGLVAGFVLERRARARLRRR